MNTPTVIQLTSEKDDDESSSSINDSYVNRGQGSKSEIVLKRPQPFMRINHSQEQSESIQELHDDSEEQYEVSIIPLEQERNEGEVSARRKVRVVQKSFSTIQDKI